MIDFGTTHWMLDFGWTLVHFLWQGALIAFVIAIVLRLLRQNKAQTRYLVGCIGLGMMAIAPMITFAMLSNHSANIEIAEQPALATITAPARGDYIADAELRDKSHDPTLDSPETTTEAETDDVHELQIEQRSSMENSVDWIVMARRAQDASKPVLPYLVIVWAIGVAFFSMRLMVSLLQAQKVKATGKRPLEQRKLQQLLDAVCKQMGVTATVKILESAIVEVPTMIGHVKPVILLPASAITGLTTQQLEAILAHELAHIRRADYIINILQSIIENVLFYHPAVWWISKQIRVERENCCDDLAANHCQDRKFYASALLQLEQSRLPLKHTIAMQASSGSLLDRIARLLGKPTTRQTSPVWVASVGSLLIAGLIIACWTNSLPAGENPETDFTHSISSSSKHVQEDDAAVEDEEPKIKVKVVDENNRPIANATVFASIWTPTPVISPNQQVTTDEDGIANVNLFEQHYIVRIWAKADGYVPLFAGWEEEEIKNGNEVPKEFVFRMTSGTTVGGFVKNEKGEPIVGAKVDVHVSGASTDDERIRISSYLAYSDEAGVSDGTAAITDENGYWQVNNAPADPNAKFQVRVRHKDYINDERMGYYQKLQGLTDDSFREKTATIVMDRGVEVAGKLTDSDGEPVSNAVVVWGDKPYWDSGSQEVRSDSDGSFEFQPLPPGKTRITVIAQNYRPETRIVDVDEMMDKVNFELQAGSELFIKVVDKDGNPVPGAYIGIEKWQGVESLYNNRHPNVLPTNIPIQADPGGVYHWTWAPDDEVTYTIGQKGYIQKRNVRLAANGEVHTVTLDKPMTLAGDVVDKKTGDRIKEFRVVPVTYSGPFDQSKGREQRPLTEPGRNGRFRIDINREAAFYQIRIEAEGYKPLVSERYKIEDEVPRLRLELEEAQWLEGQIVDPNGQPVKDQKVYVAHASKTLVLQDFFLHAKTQTAKTDENGQFKLPATEYPYTIVVTHKDGYAEVVQKPGKPVGKIQLKKWGSIEGTLLVDGKPKPGIKIGCRGIRYQYGRSFHVQGMSVVTTDINGKYKFERVPPIQVEVHPLDHLYDSVHNGTSIPVSLKPDENRTVDFGKGIEVKGKLQLSGAPHGLEGKNSLTSAMQEFRIIPIAAPSVELTEELAAKTNWQKGWAEYDRMVKERDVHAYTPYLRSFPNYKSRKKANSNFSFHVLVPGEYEMDINFYASNSRNENGSPIGNKRFRFTIDRQSATTGTFDLGTIEVEAYKGLKLGEAVPDFEFNIGPHRKPDSIQPSDTRHLSYLRGKYLLLDFWVPWGERSNLDMSKLTKLADDFKESDRLLIVSIEPNPFGYGTHTRAPESGHPIWSNGVFSSENAKELMTQLGIWSVPHYKLVDPRGKLIYQGTLDGAESKVRELLKD